MACWPLGAILIGVLAGVGCAYAVGLKYTFGYDDSLDVVGVHLVGGVIGTLAIGLVASPDSPAGVAGLLYGGGVDQLWRQFVGAVAVMVFSFVVSYALGLAIEKTIGFRAAASSEHGGIDLAEHSEVGYDLTPVQHSAYRGVRQTLLLDPSDLPAKKKEEVAA